MARRRSGRRNSPYRFTPRRKAALAKAQMISVRKRSRLGTARNHISKNREKYAALAGIAIAGGVLGNRKRQSIAKKQGAIRQLNGKKVTIKITRHRPMANDTFEGNSRISRSRGQINVYSGDRRHVTRISGVNTSVLSGGKTATLMPRRPVDRDSIPLYKDKVSKSWPHVSGKVARKQNARLRRKGLLE